MHRLNPNFTASFSRASSWLTARSSPLKPISPMKAISAWAGRSLTLLETATAYYGVADPACIVPGPGSQALIQWLPRLVPPTRVCIVGPTYQEHQVAWRLAEHEVIERVLDLTSERLTLAAYRERRWARSVGELEAGLSSWAAAVLTPEGEALAAITVSGATSRLPDERGPEVVERLLAAADELGALVAG